MTEGAPKRANRLVTVGVATALALGGVGIFVATRGGDQPRPVATATPSAAAASPSPEKTVPTITLTPRTAEPSPSPTLMPIESIMGSKPEQPVTYEMLQEDVKKAFEDPLVQSIPQANVTNYLQDCKSAPRIADRKASCSALIERFFRFYSSNGNPNSFILSQDVYNFATGPQGPYYNNSKELDTEIKAHSS